MSVVSSGSHTPYLNRAKSPPRPFFESSFSSCNAGRRLPIERTRCRKFDRRRFPMPHTTDLLAVRLPALPATAVVFSAKDQRSKNKDQRSKAKIRDRISKIKYKNNHPCSSESVSVDDDFPFSFFFFFFFFFSLDPFSFFLGFSLLPGAGF